MLEPNLITVLSNSFILQFKNHINNSTLNEACMKVTLQQLKVAILGSTIEEFFAKIEKGNLVELLHESIKRGELEVARFLAANNVDINAKNANDEIALHIAVWSGNSDIVKFLLESKVDINAKDELGRTALSVAIWNKVDLDIAQILINHGGEIDAQEQHVITLFKHFVFLGFIKLKPLLFSSTNIVSQVRENSEVLASAEIAYTFSNNINMKRSSTSNKDIHERA